MMYKKLTHARQNLSPCGRPKAQLASQGHWPLATARKQFHKASPTGPKGLLAIAPLLRASNEESVVGEVPFA